MNLRKLEPETNNSRYLTKKRWMGVLNEDWGCPKGNTDRDLKRLVTPFLDLYPLQHIGASMLVIHYLRGGKNSET